jgi:hypothetical protein
LGLQPIITDLLHKGLLRPTHSPYNSPILAVKKANGTYCLVQDLRLINNAVKPIHPLLPNPYTILSSIPASSTYFSVLDLKDAFFTIPLSPDSQDIFAFTWTDPPTHHSQQLTWTVLPQGFRDSPHLFGQALASDLKNLHLSRSTLLQYVDDLLLCSPSLNISQADTTLLLNFLADKKYQASLHKAQLSQLTVTHLGVQLSHDSKAITLDRKQLIREMPAPKTKEEILSFLGLAGYFRVWIPNYSLLAAPLYDALRETPLNLYLPLSTPLSDAFNRHSSRPQPSTCQISNNHSPSMSMKIKA